MTGKLMAIHLRTEKGKSPQSYSEVQAVPERGLKGDYQFDAERDPEECQDATLIEQEALEALKQDYQIELSAADSRRNLLTQGVPLNHLVGREFQIGGVKFLGVELCEPCGHLEKLNEKPGLIKGLRHRGGLRARILSEGTFQVGDTVSWTSTVPS